MALTTTEEAWIKKEKKRADYQAQIQTLNDAAKDQMIAKRAEITTIQTKLVSDVNVIQSQIDAL